MLKITKTGESATDVQLKLEGNVAGQWAYLLDGVCRAYLRDKKTVWLDCAQVDVVDAQGSEVLKNLPHRRVKTIGAPLCATQLHLTGDQP